MTDCGCGRKDNCPSNLIGMALGLASNETAYLRGEYKKAHPKNRRKQKALMKHMSMWIQEQLKSMDCGCGCGGRKKLAELSGGKLKKCPEGFKDNGAGLCVENCRSDEIDTGVSCVKKCGPGQEDTGIECIDKNCPQGYADSGVLTCIQRGCNSDERDDGTACWGDLKTHCHGDPRKPVWEPGHQVCKTNDGNLRRYHQTILKQRHKKDIRFKKMESSIDFAGTWADFRKGLEQFFKGELDLAELFDPEKNGVAEAFRKFGANSKKAFEEIGKNMLEKFDPEKNGVGQAFRAFGEKLKETVGNESWWKDTMSDPDTWIMIVGFIAAAAATALSFGTLGPASVAAIVALNALGPSMKMIATAARGEPIDATDIAMLALALVPVPGASGASGVAANALVKTAAISAKTLSYAAKAAQLGQIVVEGVKIAQLVGAVPTACIANCNNDGNAFGGPPETACEVKKVQWKARSSEAGFKGPDWKTPEGHFTADCPAPACAREDWSMEKGCVKQTPPPANASPQEKYKSALRDWKKARGKETKFEWTAEFPKPTCSSAFFITETDYPELESYLFRCLTDEELDEFFAKEQELATGAEPPEYAEDGSMFPDQFQPDGKVITEEELRRQWEEENKELLEQRQKSIEARKNLNPDVDYGRPRFDEPVEAPVDDTPRFGMAKPSRKSRQMKQMGLDASQRPSAAYQRQLQRKRAETQTVKILPYEERPNLLGEVPVRNTIGTSATGGRLPVFKDIESKGEWEKALKALVEKLNAGEDVNPTPLEARILTRASHQLGYEDYPTLTAKQKNNVAHEIAAGRAGQYGDSSVAKEYRGGDLPVTKDPHWYYPMSDLSTTRDASSLQF